MAGYWLGYKVIEKLRSKYSLEEMTRWNSEKYSEIAKSVLIQFTQNKTSD